MTGSIPPVQIAFRRRTVARSVEDVVIAVKAAKRNRLAQRSRYE
jgi:hypothetical protein